MESNRGSDVKPQRGYFGGSHAADLTANPPGVYIENLREQGCSIASQKGLQQYI